jgi:hypothetical protein
MQRSGLSARGTASRRGDLRRSAAVVVLLGAGALALRAGSGGLAPAGTVTLPSAARHVVSVGFSTLIGLCAVAFVVMLVALFRGARWKRSPEDDLYVQEDPLLPWWVRPLALLVGLAAIAVPIVLLVLSVHGHHQAQLTPPVRVGQAPRTHPPARQRTPAGTGSSWPAAAWLAAAAVAVAALLIPAWRRRRAAPPTAGDATTGGQALAEALTAGSAAFGAQDDPRQAIIACYAAMEEALTSTDSPPLAADTPAEVVGRAAAAGLIATQPADTLTGLFRRARYSRHPLTAADRGAAEQALDWLRADLAGPASRAGARGHPAGPGSQEGASCGQR